MTKLLVIDNYDSFTFNLVQMFRLYPLNISVYRNTDISLEKARDLSPDYILISPGPRDPAHAGISVSLIKAFYTKVPVLGVCLGMQCMNEVFGGQTIRASIPVHGKTSLVYHNNEGIFKSLPNPFRAARYHSLVVKTATGCLKVTARTSDQVVMGMAHPQFPLYGVQFHPESFLTEDGFTLIENFLRLGALNEENRVKQNCRGISL
jgi:anthranilate synthase component 2